MTMASLPGADLWTLRADVHAVAVDDDLVLLDVVTDAYFCLPGAGHASQLNSTNRTVRLADPELAQELRQATLIEPHQESAITLTHASVLPVDTALRPAYERPRAVDLPEAVVAVADLLFHYRGRSLAELTQRVRNGRPDRPRGGDLLAAVDRFQRWIPYAPVSGKCLLRSFMLLRLLHRQGLDADWVFGVATWPFKAHCWLQSGSLVLDDHPDRVMAFTPIMVV